MKKTRLLMSITMFKFNFSAPYQESEKGAEKKNNENVAVSENIRKNEGRVVEITAHIREKVEEYKQDSSTVYPFRSVTLVNVQHLEEVLSDGNKNFEILTTAIQMNSDVIKGVYEGGLKIWECTIDLLDHIEKEPISFKGMDVLDLGCGAGVLGVEAVLKEASSVHFQDYNTEVLELVTIPNVLLNVSTDEVEKRTKFFSGDWELLEEMLSSYDIVLTAETIYSPDNYLKLLKIFEKVIKPSGTIYLAAKQHYFGVGGNLRQFEQLLLKNNKWNVKSVFITEEGVKREILKITKVL